MLKLVLLMYSILLLFSVVKCLVRWLVVRNIWCVLLSLECWEKYMLLKVWDSGWLFLF